MDWFRWHHGTVTDPKWRVAAAEASVRVADVLAIWAAMLEHASQNDPRGSLSGFRDRVTGAALDIPTESVAAVRQAMEGLVLENGEPASWEKRQPKREDPSTDRVRKHRQKKRSETQSNAPDRERDKESESEEKGSSSNDLSSSAGVREKRPDPTDRQSTIFEAIILANRGMGDNEHIGDALNPIPVGHGSGEVVGEWYDAGVPWDTIKRAVYWTAEKYKPSAGNRQITTMRYFDPAVKERHARAVAKQAAANVQKPAPDPERTERAAPAGAPRQPSVADLRAKDEVARQQEAERKQREDAAVAKWEASNEIRARALRNEVEQTTAANPFALPHLREGIVRTEYRKRVLEILNEKAA
jgi:hypothetical protein